MKWIMARASRGEGTWGGTSGPDHRRPRDPATPRLPVMLLLLAVLATPGVADDPKPAPKVVPLFRLSGPVTESGGGASPLDLLTGGSGTTLRDLVARLDRAAGDRSVRAVAILFEGGSAGSAQAEELIAAIDRLKAAGKPVHAWAESIGTSDYLLLSAASRISVVPTGDVWLTGLYAESPYLRGLLDLIGVEPDYLTCGDYKSAAEMFMRTGPSLRSVEMSAWLLDSRYETYLSLIAAGRDVEVVKVQKWIDDGPYTARRARKKGLIDAVEHRQKFLGGLKKSYGDDVRLATRYGLPPKQTIDLSSPFGLLKLYTDLLQGSSTPIRRALDQVAADDSVKAVVLRVNSPGGSATASEIILDATRRVQATGKPLVVSMGDVAGSGGYYVACRADAIFADATTITGSIGVVGGKFATNGVWQKLGISFSTRSRGRQAAILSSARVFTPDERQRMQAWMDEIYGVFKGHVVDGRGKRLKKKIDDIAGGRVYTGRQALKLGLVDKLGGLEDAIADAAERAGLKQYQRRVVPPSKGLLELLMSDGDEVRLPGIPGAASRKLSLLDLADPMVGKLEPHRVAAVRRALTALELLQNERVLLLMPEIGFHD